MRMVSDTSDFFNKHMTSNISGFQGEDEFGVSVPMSSVNVPLKRYDSLVRKNIPNKVRVLHRQNSIKKQGEEQNAAMQSLNFIR